MLSSILRSLSKLALVLILFLPVNAYADTGTPVMNVSGSGSDYIFVYEGNDSTTYADLSALGNSIIGWTATCTSGNCTVGDTLIVGSIGGNGNDYLFLYTEDSDGNVVYPVSGAWYSFSAPVAAATPIYGTSGLTTAQATRVAAKQALADNGQGNTVEIDIDGSSNDIFIEQAGGPSYVLLSILGNTNAVDIDQDMDLGAHGYTEIAIIGDSNEFDLIQTGSADKAAFVLIEGDSNDVLVSQTGDGSHYLDLEVEGDNHEVDVLQSGSGDHEATIALDGSQPWNFELNQTGATNKTYTLPHTMTDGSGVSGTCNAIGGCNLTVYQND